MGSYKQSMEAVMILFLVLNAFAVSARIYCRAVLVKAFGWDDVFIGFAFLGYIVACSFGFAAIYYGFASDTGDMEAHKTYHDTEKVVKYYWSNQLLLYISSGVVKIGIALVLYRLATNVRNQAILVLSICVVIVWTCVTTIFSMDMCASEGSADYAGNGVCGGVGYFRMISNIFLDYFFALYPIPMLWRSTLSTRMKLIVCGLLGLGIIASAATIAKLVILVKLLLVPTGYQSDWLHYQLLIWADAELGLAIFCSSIAALRPLLRVMGGHSLSNVNRLSGTANGRTPDPDASDQPTLGTQTKRQGFAASTPDDVFELTSVDTLKDDRRVNEHEKRASSLRAANASSASA